MPVAVLNRVTADGFDWQVPGLREDLAVALLKSLPKATRRHFVPTPDHAMAALAEADPSARPAHRRAGPGAPRAHRRPHPAGGVGPSRGCPTTCGSPSASTAPAAGSSPAARTSTRCGRQAGGAVRPAMARAGASIERTGLTAWTVGDVPETFEGRSGGLTVEGYPALVDEGTSVALRVLARPAVRREAAHRRGVRRLLLLNTTAPWKRVLARLTNAQKLALADNPHGSVPALLQDCLDAAVDAIVAEHVPGEVRTEDGVRGGARRRAHPRRDPGARRRRGGRAGARPGRPGAPHARRARARAPPRRAPPRPAPTCGPSSTASCAPVSSRRPAWPGCATCSATCAAMQHRLERAATNPREPVLQEQVDARGDRLRRPARVAARRPAGARPR